MPRRPQKSAKRATGSSSQPTVSHSWLMKAIAAVVIVALICAYLTLSLLFYQGQWQLVLHPKHETQAPESSSIHFAPDESATPQLTGRWIPAAPGARYANSTILFLPSGDGSLSDFNATLDRLHNLGINVFAFDYRGYGYSADTHPNQLRMTQDAESAWTYLNTSRGIPAHQIIPYGIGVGASLATHLASAHSDIPALILESPKGDLLDTVRHDPHVTLMPVRLLFHENFPLAEQLASLHTPKLLISHEGASPVFRTASDPKLTVESDSSSDATYSQSLTRFLDQYVAPPTPSLVPTPAPVPTNHP
jgi:pimeloyl-ACP methyl ester carboxylesterase